VNKVRTAISGTFIVESTVIGIAVEACKVAVDKVGVSIDEFGIAAGNK